MEKKKYIVPFIEVMNLNADLLQSAPLFGQGSMPADPMSNGAPEREKVF